MENISANLESISVNDDSLSRESDVASAAGEFTSGGVLRSIEIQINKVINLLSLYIYMLSK